MVVIEELLPIIVSLYYDFALEYKCSNRSYCYKKMRKSLIINGEKFHAKLLSPKGVSQEEIEYILNKGGFIRIKKRKKVKRPFFEYFNELNRNGYISKMGPWWSYTWEYTEGMKQQNQKSRPKK